MKVERDNQRAADLVREVTQCTFCPPFTGFVIRDDTRKIRGAVVLNDYTGNNVELCGAGYGCWTPKVVRTLARYIFKEIGCKRVTARTRLSAHNVRAALRAMGFECEGTACDWYDDGEPAVLYGLLARKQRLIRL